MADISRAVSSRAVGEALTLTVLRDGRRLTLRVVLDDRPGDVGVEPGNPWGSGRPGEEEPVGRVVALDAERIAERREERAEGSQLRGGTSNAASTRPKSAPWLR